MLVKVKTKLRKFLVEFEFKVSAKELKLLKELLKLIL